MTMTDAQIKTYLRGAHGDAVADQFGGELEDSNPNALVRILESLIDLGPLGDLDEARLILDFLAEREVMRPEQIERFEKRLARQIEREECTP